MPFRTRNSFYLRISANNVIPLYLYLDDRHIDWMTERTLHHVVSDLRPLIFTKLYAERNAHYGPGGPANAKKGTVEVHRGDNYQFAYFLRKVEPHAVVVKNRSYVMLPPKPKPAIVTERPNPGESKRKRKKASGDTAPSVSDKSTKRPRKASKTSKARASPHKKERVLVGDSEEEAADLGSSSEADEGKANEPGPNHPRRSTRSRKATGQTYRDLSDNEEAEPFPVSNDGDVEMADNIPSVQSPTKNREASESVRINLAPSVLPPIVDVDEDEEKPKPELQLSYQAFPPPSRAASVAPSLQLPRAPSIAPPDFMPSESATSERDRQTPAPLFLPDFDRDRSVTPAPLAFSRFFTPLDDLAEDQPLESNGDDDFGMMAFSQALHSISGDGAGGFDDDDELDGGVLFGDADENRGLVQ